MRAMKPHMKRTVQAKMVEHSLQALSYWGCKINLATFMVKTHANKGGQVNIANISRPMFYGA